MKRDGRGSGDKTNVGRKPMPEGIKRVIRSVRANDVEWADVMSLAIHWECSISDAVLRAVAEATAREILE